VIHAVIFDMDGLILDTEPLYRAAWQQAAAECGYVLPDVLYSRLAGQKRADAELLLREEFGLAFPLETFRTACHKFEASVLASGPVPKKPGLDELLAFLDSRHIRKAVATSTERETTVTHLAAAELLGRFDAVTTGDEVANGKPSPDLFLLAARRLGAGNQACLVLEDSEPGVIAAHRAGMHVYLVPDMLPPSSTAVDLASRTFDSLSAVARYLKLQPMASDLRE
jgi:HAD superfamily hydrolase (TIGR01509 family)